MSNVATVHERMAAAIADLSYIPKGKSSGVTYEFRGIDAVMNHLHPVLATHGLYLSPRVLDDWQVNMIPGTNNRVQSQALFRVCVDVYAADGSTVALGPGLAQSHDYGDKAVYQAQQNAIKYVLLEAFCIPTAEQDMDGREADAVPTPQMVEVDRLIGAARGRGITGDYDATRAWAAERPDNIGAAISKLRKAIAKHDSQDSSDGGEAVVPHGEGGATQPPPSEDTAPPVGTEGVSGSADTDREAAVEGEGEPASGTPPRGTSSPSPDTTDPYDWKAHCTSAGVKKFDVVKALIKDWPSNNLAARPNKVADVDALLSRDLTMVEVVRGIVGDLADAKGSV